MTPKNARFLEHFSAQLFFGPTCNIQIAVVISIQKGVQNGPKKRSPEIFAHRRYRPWEDIKKQIPVVISFQFWGVTWRVSPPFLSLKINQVNYYKLTCQSDKFTYEHYFSLQWWTTHITRFSPNFWCCTTFLHALLILYNSLFCTLFLLLSPHFVVTAQVVFTHNLAY